MKKTLLLLSFCCYLSISLFSQVKTAVGNSGNGWSSNNNWSATGVPTNGDTLLIPASTSLTVKGNIYNGVQPRLVVYVYGTLDFDPSGKLELADMSEIHVYNNGSIISNNTSSEVITINDVVKFNGKTDGFIAGPSLATNTTGVSPNGFGPMSVLPVHLLDFKMEKKSTHHCLTWQMISGDGQLDYILEKKSVEGNWKTLVNKSVVTKPGELHTDSFVETDLAAINQYRIKYQDAQGDWKYSKILQANETIDDVKVVVYPNPATNFIKITANHSLNNSEIRIMNQAGHIVYQTTITNQTTAEIQLPKLTRGVYYLSCVNDSMMHRSSFMVK